MSGDRWDRAAHDRQVIFSDRPWRDELARRVPDLPEETFAGILSGYCYDHGRRDPMPPRKVRDELDRMGAEVTALLVQLKTMSAEGRDWLITEACRAGAPDLLREVDTLLTVVAGVCEMGRRGAERQAKDGRPVAPMTRLIRGLALALHEQGHVPDSSRNGPLFQATTIALDAVGHKTANLDTSVSKALNNWIDKP